MGVIEQSLREISTIGKWIHEYIGHRRSTGFLDGNPPEFKVENIYNSELGVHGVLIRFGVESGGCAKLDTMQSHATPSQTPEPDIQETELTSNVTGSIVHPR